MKITLRTLWVALLALGATLFGVTGCKKSSQVQSGEQAPQYTCPHHPEVVQDKSGTCPKCNMKLVEKK